MIANFSRGTIEHCKTKQLMDTILHLLWKLVPSFIGDDMEFLSHITEKFDKKPY